MLAGGVDSTDESGQRAFLHIGGGPELLSQLQAGGRRSGGLADGEFSGNDGERVHQFNGGRGLKLDRH
ncbi:hypothetical protein ACFYTC_32915 [Actinomadura nitritigenes]|uniref:hypothetical protein n=1 Tax=Actinomadura nitritigenes TaxID=134602 RepID=UPI0036AE04A0